MNYGTKSNTICKGNNAQHSDVNNRKRSSR